jgi:PEP-CTERM motif
MNRRAFTGLLSLAVACTIPVPMRAGNISEIDIFKNQVFTQTSGAAPTTPSSFFANIELDSVNPGDFDAVSVSYPGPASPTSLTLFGPAFWGYGPGFTTQADMDAAVPTGAYNYTATNSVTSDIETATLNYTGDSFGSAIPALAPATWGALNGLDPSTALTVDFNTFTPGAATTPGQGFVFFTIASPVSGTVFTDGFLDPSTGSVLLPAGTLAPDTTYDFELDFSDRQVSTDSVSGATAVIASDLRDDGTFTTGAIGSATPEPGTWLLFGSGLAMLAGARRRS